ncbi:MAG: ATP-binding cassette domain-containing protein, partial [Salinisphaera sp.]|nr:ATP-binding cassette domain-containing protein [Salinisphaera sp.]
MTEPNKPAILRVHELRTWLDTPQGVVRAVNSVSFTLERGRTLALLGESGCGKSMTALSLMRLVPEPAGHIVGGAVELDGTDLL